MKIESQATAINSRNSNILLSASAGTGKTYTMVKRIISLIEEGYDISQFLVLVFGNDAAKEIKDRVLVAIEELAKTDEKYLPQLGKIKLANISTISAFSLEIVKSYFAVAKVSPKCRILEGTEDSILRATAMENVFLNCYESGDEEFLSLVEYFSQSRKDEKLKEIVEKIYNLSRNMPKGDFQKTVLETLNNDIFEKKYLEMAKSEAEELLALADQIIPLKEFKKQYLEVVSLLKSVQMSGCISDMEFLLGMSFSRKSIPKGSSDNVIFLCNNFYSKLRDPVKDKFHKNIVGHIKCHMETRGERGKHIQIVKNLLHLTDKFQAEFSRLKWEKDYVDFSDTEHMLLDIIRDEKCATELRERFKFVFCDEYQDVSKLQEAILSEFSKDGNLFCVGDIKQNIYGFRSCDQTIIKARELDILQNGNGLFLPMNNNFRSQKDILEFINTVFSVAMNDPQTCEYEKSSMFSPMRDFPSLGGVEIAVGKKLPKPEEPRKAVYSVEGDCGRAREEVNAEMEGWEACNFIKRYLGTTYQFAEGSREVKFSDFAILLRSVSGKFAKTLARVLEENNIPSFITSSESLLCEHSKILYLVDFLKCINNPMDDISLYSTLISPFFEESDNTILQIKSAEEGKFFHQSFFGFAKKVAIKHSLKSTNFLVENSLEKDQPTEENQEMQQSSEDFDIFCVDFSPLLLEGVENISKAELCCAKFMQAHAKFSALSLVSTSAMLEKAMREFHIKEKIILSAGEMEWEYVVNFLKMLSSFEDTSLAYACEKIEKAFSTMKLSEAQTSTNAVKIMTMHKSKGLEFPFCIIMNTGKKYNNMDTKEVVLSHKDYGIACPIHDVKTKKRTSTIDKITLAKIISRENKAEELRLLYVALSRAKYKLLITGTLGCDFQIVDNIVFADHISKIRSQRDFLACDSYMKLILSSLASSKYSSNYTVRRMERFSPCEEKKIEFAVQDNIATKLASRMLNFHKTNVVFPEILTKFTATQRLDDCSKICDDENLDILEKYELSKIAGFQPPTETTQLSKTQIGTLYHKILEEIPFFLSEEEIEKFISKMKENGEIDEFPFDAKKIFNLTNNKLFHRGKIKREVPFVMQADAELLGFQSGYPVLLQGIIDCICEMENGEIILVDYKATQIRNGEILREKYRKQLETYKLACEKILKKSVKQCYIYSIFSEELIEVDC